MRARPRPSARFFLENLLRAKPDDADLRLLLAQHYLEVGQVTQAQITLSQLLDSTRDSIWLNARLLDLRMQKIRTLSFPDGSAERRNGMEQLRKQIKMVVTSNLSLQTDILTQLAHSAILTGDPRLAETLYERLGEQSEPQASTWYAKAASVAYGRGAFRKAAELYFLAQKYALNQKAKKTYYLSALKVLQAGSLFAEAIHQAEKYLGELKHDEETLLFLVALGRATGNGAFAQKYVKDLLQIAYATIADTVIPVGHDVENHQRLSSWVFAPISSIINDYEDVSRWAQIHVHPWDRLIANSQLSHGSFKLRPFDDQIYALAYTVFLENQNLHDAFSVAQAAVQQVPQQLEWRKRLARVAEWMGRQDLALQQWRYVAEKNPTRSSFQEILRLAPGALDDSQVIFSLLGLGKIRSLSEGEWRRLIDAFEREGLPNEAIAYLTRLNEKSPTQDLQESIAMLYQRKGNSDLAYQSYRTLENQYGIHIRWSTQQANLLALRGDLQSAYMVLQHAKNKAQADDQAFWKVLGHLAWTLEEDQQAEEAYRYLWTHQQLSREGQERLMLLIQQNRPFEAIEVGLTGWRNFHSPKFLLQALDLLLQEKNYIQIQTILEDLLPWEEKLLIPNERYWIIRAEALGKIGQKDEALHAYQRAMLINPDSSETKETFLWFLVDQNDQQTLDSYIKKWRTVIENDPRLWGAAAAAYIVLDRPKLSLPFFVRQLKKNQHDYLWLLNYASALEASSNTALAWEVRQRAWLGVRQVLLTKPSSRLSPQMLEAFAMLASIKEPGDTLLELLRREETNLQSPVMKELVLSWLLSQEAFEAAKIWLWKNYARRLTAPGWAELAIALKDNDWESIHSIVVKHRKTLSRSDKIEAAHRLDHLTLAQDLAFESLTQDPGNDASHNQYHDALMSAVHRITSRLRIEDRRPLSSYTWKTAMPIQLGRVEVRPEASVSWQSSTEATELTGVPRLDRQIGASIGYRRPTSLLRLTGFHRSAVSKLFGVGLAYEQTWNEHLSSTLTLGRNHKADDSIVLQVGGVKDFIRGQGLYYFSKREFLSLQIDAPWFFTQSRDDLGRGLGIESTLGHHIRREYPDVTIRVTGNLQRYWRVNTLPTSIRRLIPNSQAPTSDRVVPRGFSQWGMNLSLGDSIRDVYTKGIRPFGLIGMNHNSAGGFGFSLEGGMAARLLGQDRLVLSGSHIRGGFGQNATTTQVNLEYQRWF